MPGEVSDIVMCCYVMVLPGRKHVSTFTLRINLLQFRPPHSRRACYVMVLVGGLVWFGFPSVRRVGSPWKETHNSTEEQMMMETRATADPCFPTISKSIR